MARQASLRVTERALWMARCQMEPGNQVYCVGRGPGPSKSLIPNRRLQNRARYRNFTSNPRRNLRARSVGNDTTRASGKRSAKKGGRFLAMSVLQLHVGCTIGRARAHFRSPSLTSPQLMLLSLMIFACNSGFQA